jgi:hypothetical protein
MLTTVFRRGGVSEAYGKPGGKVMPGLSISSVPVTEILLSLSELGALIFAFEELLYNWGRPYVSSKVTVV